MQINLKDLKTVLAIREAAQEKIEHTPNFYWKTAYSNLCLAADHLALMIKRCTIEEDPPNEPQRPNIQ